MLKGVEIAFRPIRFGCQAEDDRVGRKRMQPTPDTGRNDQTLGRTVEQYRVFLMSIRKSDSQTTIEGKQEFGTSAMSVSSAFGFARYVINPEDALHRERQRFIIEYR